MGWPVGCIIHRFSSKDEWAEPVRMHGSDILHSRYDISMRVCVKHAYPTAIDDNEQTSSWKKERKKMKVTRHDLLEFCKPTRRLQRAPKWLGLHISSISRRSKRHDAKFPLTYHLLHHFSLSTERERINRFSSSIEFIQWTSTLCTHTKYHKCKSWGQNANAVTQRNGTKYKRLMSINGIDSCLFPKCWHSKYARCLPCVPTLLGAYFCCEEISAKNVLRHLTCVWDWIICMKFD